MANPFTYLELHSTDATRVKAFYAELFGWTTKDIPAPTIGAYTPRPPFANLMRGPGCPTMVAAFPCSAGELTLC
jgi:predicted enzyme related to lactoylglutathione lyase